MSERYKVIYSEIPNFITIIGWLDLLIRRVYTNIIDDALNYCIKKKPFSNKEKWLTNFYINILKSAYSTD